jgi:O-antigen ligase
MHAGTGAFAAAALLMGGPWWSRVIGLISLPLIMNAIVQTQSRGAFVAIALSGPLFLFFMPKRTGKRLTIAGLVSLFLLLPVVPSNYWDRIGTIQSVGDDNAEVDGSIATRFSLFRAQWKMFLEYPYGSGHRGTAFLSPRYLRDDELTYVGNDPNQVRRRSSHNTFLTILTEQGVPGVILLLSICTWMTSTALDLRKRLAASGTSSDHLRHALATAVATLSVVLVAGLFADYFKAEVFVWGLALLAALNAMPKQSSDAPLEAAPSADTSHRNRGDNRLGHAT